MEPRPLQFFVDACSAKLVNASPASVALGFSTDSRKARKGELFLALKGERFDAHDFVPEVLNQGALAALVEESSLQALPPSGSYLVTSNTRLALGKIAARYRKDFDIPYIVIGGSNGKTSTKELVAAVLGSKLQTLRAEGSFNNDIGVPLTLLSLTAKHQAAVIEVGSNHPGELAPLLRMIEGGIGIITSIGREHLEFFGSLDGVFEEEAEVARAMPPDGLLLIPGDSPFADRLAAAAKCKVLRVGFAEENDVQVGAFEMHPNGAAFNLRMNGSVETYRTNLIGKHQLINAAYAIVVGKELGLGRSEIQSGLDHARPAKMRMELMKVGGFHILNDAYNANADSMIAALHTLRDFPANGRKIAILGNMAELGQHSEQSHREIGALAASCGLDLLLTTGKEAALISESARHASFPEARHFQNLEELAATLAAFAQMGDLILIKGSRSSRMERTLDLLQSHMALGKQEAVIQ
ncbi:MAG: UDP-N-acetylmuramoyl-tripeptide--D-alanyl-D-alanine ligase [Verrucomicrobiales bacterium]